MRLLIHDKIETTRLILQRFRQEDADEIFFTYASKPESTKYMAWPTHQSIYDTRTFLNYAVQGWTRGVDYSFAIRLRSNNRLIGSCGMLNDEGKIQFGYVLGPVHWRNGYATEATQAMLNEVKPIKEVYRVNTFVDAENTASLRVVQKCGLVEEARLEKWFRFPNQNSQPKDCILFRLPLDR